MRNGRGERGEREGVFERERESGGGGGGGVMLKLSLRWRPFFLFFMLAGCY